MNNYKYQKLVDELTPNENRIINMIISFFVGGGVGVIGTYLFTIFNNTYTEELSISFMLLIIIAVTAFFTGLGFTDTLFLKAKCGLIIPITGFAHSVTASLIDYKREGFINIGANAFKLAGSVLVYGIVSAVLFTILGVILNV